MSHCPECDRRAFIIRSLADAITGAGAAIATRGAVNPLAGDIAGAALGPVLEQAVLGITGQQRHPSGAAEKKLRPSPSKRGGKISKYHKQLGKELKKLKKKHPRTQAKNLLKRAHRLTKKALK